MERCNFEGTEMVLPVDLIENPEILSHVLSLDTWKHVLTTEDRNKLKNYLPVLPTDYPHAQLENLRALFGGENFKFGNPLQTFARKLQAGHYVSDITKFRRQCKAAKQKEYKLKLKKFYRKLVHDVLISRQEIIDKVLSTSHQDATIITLSWHERQLRKGSSLSGNLECKYKKIMKEIKDECEDQSISSDEELGAPDLPLSMASGSTSTPNQNTVIEEDYHRMLYCHKRKRLNKEDHPELDTHSITLEDIIARTNVTTKKVLKTAGKRKMKGKDKKEHFRKLKKKRAAPTSFSDQPVVPAAAASVNDVVDPAPPIKIDEENLNPKSCKYLEKDSACFFSLLRDIFLSLPDSTAELGQLERMVRDWQVSSAFASSSWSSKEPSWSDLIPSALKYLGGSTKAVANNPLFLSLVIFKQKVHQWKWIGTFRDNDCDLLPLCENWFETKDQVVAIEPATSTAAATSLNSVKRTDYVVGPSTSDEKTEYQNQEKDRYENPHKPFIYQMHGFESIVAPVKGVFTKESNLNKAREHSLLVSKRPPYVTILTLVRDAAARLPNGEGTRAEVCQLLKDSQYINPHATDAQIHTVVSGALDRLHYEKDPCVKYDNARKVWIYLHKTRSVEEFEKIHEASAAAARAKKQMSQKQKQIKQQQKAKETAISALNASPLQTSVEDGNNVVAGTIVGSALPEVTTTTKTTKKTKPKRLTVSPKKTDKPKVKVKKESVEIAVPNTYSIDRSHQLSSSVLASVPPLNSYQDSSQLDYREHQDESMFLNPTSSAFARTSRLNSPYMGIVQPVQDNMPFGDGTGNVSIKTEPGFENVIKRERSSSSSSTSGSDSESESSSGDEDISRRPFNYAPRQDSILHFGGPRMPFNNVMSLGQENPNGSESDSAFSGYY